MVEGGKMLKVEETEIKSLVQDLYTESEMQ